MDSRMNYKKIILLIIIFLGSFGGIPFVYAQGIKIVYDDTQSFHQDFIKLFSQKNLNQQHYGYELVTLDKVGNLTDDDLIVTIGHKAASLTVNHKGKALHTFNSKRSIEILYKDKLKKDHYAIYLDQPLERSISLIQHVLFDIKTIDVIFSENTNDQITEVKQLLEKRHIKLKSNWFNSGSSQIQQIESIAKQSQLLLLIPDILVVNQNNARPLIVSAYKNNVPLVAYSRAMVKAGALMAVYTTLEQVVAQTLNTINTIQTNKQPPLLQLIPPDDFDVAVNYQVARILKLNIDSESLIKVKMVEHP